MVRRSAQRAPTHACCKEFCLLKIPEILQVETPQVPGSLASVLNVIAEAGLVLEHVTTLRREQGRTLWEITFEIEEGRRRISCAA
jgi:hypothetical protein